MKMYFSYRFLLEIDTVLRPLPGRQERQGAIPLHLDYNIVRIYENFSKFSKFFLSVREMKKM